MRIFKFVKKWFIAVLLFIFVSNLYSYEITDESIKLHDEKGNEFSLLMDFDTIKSYLGEPKDIIESKDVEGIIDGYIYDGIKFYLDFFDEQRKEKERVWLITLENTNYFITFLNFQIGKTRFQDVSDFFDVSNGKVYSRYSSEKLDLFCWFSAEKYFPKNTIELKKNGDFMIVMTFDSKTQILQKCQLSIDYGI
jgi:hypothetical protein